MKEATKKRTWFVCVEEHDRMARWPRTVRTTIFTYATIFVLFPVLCWLAYAYVQGWLF